MVSLLLHLLTVKRALSKLDLRESGNELMPEYVPEKIGAYDNKFRSLHCMFTRVLTID